MLNRRRFLATGAAACATAAHAAEPLADIPIMDTHVHLFDARRPQGVPYSGSPEWRALNGGVALPATYETYAARLNITGAIVVEASPWIEDNLWVLERIQSDTRFVGLIGNLEPEKADFPALLERHRRNPLFLGIRCGNIWGRRIADQVNDPNFMAGLRLLADAKLTMDTANPSVPLLQTILRISDAVPSLRIVLDHLPALDPTPQDRAAYDAVLRELGARPLIYAKLSEIDHRGATGGLAAHRARLDMLMGVFGEDRVLFGTDWPNSWGVATPEQIVSLARGYFATRTKAAAEKFFWHNSRAAYRWQRRGPLQPG